MRTLLSAVGRTFVRTFAAALFAYAVGVLAAPQLSLTLSLAIAGLLSSLAAGLRAIQVYVPKLTLARWIGKPWGSWADAFLRGFIGSLLVTIPNLLVNLDLSTARTIALAAVVGALNAGIHAIQDLFTAGEQPTPAFGLPEPPPAAGPPPRAAG